ncbi:MAG TPA: hypothetical protein VM183_11840, partial [Burkholderiales bacterium]|nr:hypothetical protein [Burkholderiales bacterium]
MALKPPLRVIGSGEATGKRHSLRILVVDDERDTAMTLSAILLDEGHQVHTSLRGDEALDVCR